MSRAFHVAVPIATAHVPTAGIVHPAGARLAPGRRSGRARKVATAVPAAPSKKAGRGRKVPGHSQQEAEAAEGQHAGTAQDDDVLEPDGHDRAGVSR